MQIGVVGPLGPDRFAENIGEALCEMGHAVTLLGPARSTKANRIASTLADAAQQAMPGLDERTQRRIARTALAQECELVINVDSRLMPDSVSLLNRAGVKTAFWFPDHVANIGRQLMLLAPYDALFFKEPQLVKRLRATLDLAVHYLPEACNPRLHRSLVSGGTEPYLVMAGNMYPSRVRLLERLIAKGIPLRLYGGAIPRWLGESAIRSVHTGQVIVGEEKARVFRSAVGVLNTLHPAEEAGVNARFFEAAGSGAAVLAEFRTSVPELFNIGDELLVFHDFDELVDQANRLFGEGGLSARLGDAAARRAHRDHNYGRRLAIILEKVL